MIAFSNDSLMSLPSGIAVRPFGFFAMASQESFYLQMCCLITDGLLSCNFLQQAELSVGPPVNKSVGLKAPGPGDLSSNWAVRGVLGIG